MAKTPSQIQAQIDALDDAIARGVLEVTYDGRTVKYRSIAELQRAVAHLSARKAEASGTASSLRKFVSFRKGY